MLEGQSFHVKDSLNSFNLEITKPVGSICIFKESFMRFVRSLFTISLSILLFSACSNSAESNSNSSPLLNAGSSSVTEAKLTAMTEVSTPTELQGFCDASAAISLAPDTFIVAGDEDNILRVYKPSISQKPTGTFDLNIFLKVVPKDPEVDIEGAARMGDKIYWIGSHGANKNGNARPNRRRLFATELKVANNKVTVVPVGKPYIDLIDDLSKSPELKMYALDAAAKIAPKEKNALNIEGLAATPQGTLLIGFRNPIPDGKALIVPLNNPVDVIQGKARAQLGRPILLSLGGLGIRDVEYSELHHQYFIIAGPYGEEGELKLYRWSGSSTDVPTVVNNAKFAGLQPEALVIYQDKKDKIQVLSDDGNRSFTGVKCKDALVTQQKFRSLWVSP
jgi:Protein of unknown function (DUF3616)